MMHGPGIACKDDNVSVSGESPHKHGTGNDQKAKSLSTSPSGKEEDISPKDSSKRKPTRKAGIGGFARIFASAVHSLQQPQTSKQKSHPPVTTVNNNNVQVPTLSDIHSKGKVTLSQKPSNFAQNNQPKYALRVNESKSVHRQFRERNQGASEGKDGNSESTKKKKKKKKSKHKSTRQRVSESTDSERPPSVSEIRRWPSPKCTFKKISSPVLRNRATELEAEKQRASPKDENSKVIYEPSFSVDDYDLLTSGLDVSLMSISTRSSPDVRCSDVSSVEDFNTCKPIKEQTPQKLACSDNWDAELSPIIHKAAHLSIAFDDKENGADNGKLCAAEAERKDQVHVTEDHQQPVAGKSVKNKQPIAGKSVNVLSSKAPLRHSTPPAKSFRIYNFSSSSLSYKSSNRSLEIKPGSKCFSVTACKEKSPSEPSQVVDQKHAPCKYLANKSTTSRGLGMAEKSQSEPLKVSTAVSQRCTASNSMTSKGDCSNTENIAEGTTENKPAGTWKTEYLASRSWKPITASVEPKHSTPSNKANFRDNSNPSSFSSASTKDTRRVDADVNQIDASARSRLDVTRGSSPMLDEHLKLEPKQRRSSQLPIEQVKFKPKQRKDEKNSSSKSVLETKESAASLKNQSASFGGSPMNCTTYMPIPPPCSVQRLPTSETDWITNEQHVTIEKVEKLDDSVFCCHDVKKDFVESKVENVVLESDVIKVDEDKGRSKSENNACDVAKMEGGDAKRSKSEKDKSEKSFTLAEGSHDTEKISAVHLEHPFLSKFTWKAIDSEKGADAGNVAMDKAKYKHSGDIAKYKAKNKNENDQSLTGEKVLCPPEKLNEENYDKVVETEKHELIQKLVEEKMELTVENEVRDCSDTVIKEARQKILNETDIKEKHDDLSTEAANSDVALKSPDKFEYVDENRSAEWTIVDDTVSESKSKVADEPNVTWKDSNMGKESTCLDNTQSESKCNIQNSPIVWKTTKSAHKDLERDLGYGKIRQENVSCTNVNEELKLEEKLVSEQDDVANENWNLQSCASVEEDWIETGEIPMDDTVQCNWKSASETRSKYVNNNPTGCRSSASQHSGYNKYYSSYQAFPTVLQAEERPWEMTENGPDFTSEGLYEQSQAPTTAVKKKNPANRQIPSFPLAGLNVSVQSSHSKSADADREIHPVSRRGSAPSLLGPSQTSFKKPYHRTRNEFSQRGNNRSSSFKSPGKHTSMFKKPEPRNFESMHKDTHHRSTPSPTNQNNSNAYGPRHQERMRWSAPPFCDDVNWEQARQHGERGSHNRGFKGPSSNHRRNNLRGRDPSPANRDSYSMRAGTPSPSTVQHGYSPQHHQHHHGQQHHGQQQRSPMMMPSRVSPVTSPMLPTYSPHRPSPSSSPVHCNMTHMDSYYGNGGRLPEPGFDLPQEPPFHPMYRPPFPPPSRMSRYPSYPPDMSCWMPPPPPRSPTPADGSWPASWYYWMQEIQQQWSKEHQAQESLVLTESSSNAQDNFDHLDGPSKEFLHRILQQARIPPHPIPCTMSGPSQHTDSRQEQQQDHQLEHNLPQHDGHKRHRDPEQGSPRQGDWFAPSFPTSVPQQQQHGSATAEQHYMSPSSQKPVSCSHVAPAHQQQQISPSMSHYHQQQQHESAQQQQQHISSAMSLKKPVSQQNQHGQPPPPLTSSLPSDPRLHPHRQQKINNYDSKKCARNSNEEPSKEARHARPNQHPIKILTRRNADMYFAANDGDKKDIISTTFVKSESSSDVKCEHIRFGSDDEQTNLSSETSPFALPAEHKKISFGLHRKNIGEKPIQFVRSRTSSLRQQICKGGVGSEPSSLESSPDRRNSPGGFWSDESSLDSSPSRPSPLVTVGKLHRRNTPMVDKSRPTDSDTSNLEEGGVSSSPMEGDADIDWFADPKQAEKQCKKLKKKKVKLASTSAVSVSKKTRWSGDNMGYGPWTPADQSPDSNNSSLASPLSYPSTPSGPPLVKSPSFSLLPPHLQRYCASSSSTVSANKSDVRWQNSKQRFSKRYSGVNVPYIDSHCHLDFLFDRSSFQGNTLKAFMADNPETFLPNFGGCIAVFCNPRTFLPNSGLWLRVVQEANVWLAVGCHPKSAMDFSSRAEDAMRQMIMHPKVKAVGEIGLDFSGTFFRHADIQKIVLEKQCRMAIDVKKPIVIHSRDSEQAILDTLVKVLPKNYKIHRHCFTGSWEEADAWLRLFPNSYIGLTPLVTWENSERARGPREVAARMPLNRLLLETDAPYFLPRCIYKDDMVHSHPGLAITVAEAVANLRGITITEVLEAALRNTRNMYDVTEVTLQQMAS